MRSLLRFLLFVVLGFLPAAAGWLTRPGAWYEGLEKPWFNPPSWVFGPVWTLLYLSIGVALFLYDRAEAKHRPVLTWSLVGVHLALNFAWSLLFFGLHSPAAALVDIVLMIGTLIAIIVYFWRARRAPAVLLLPYLLWICYASLLNGAILVMN